MSDCIHIKGLVLPTTIGVPDEERKLPQSVSVNLTILPIKGFCGINDNIEGTIDYYEVSCALRRVAETGERKLIETLAEDLANAVLAFDNVESVTLEVEKFILPNCDAVSVEIHRCNGN